MATPRRPRVALIRSFLVLLALAGGLAVGTPAVASRALPADRPTGPEAIAKAKRELAALEIRLDTAVEDYDAARVVLAGARRHADQMNSRVTRARAGLARAQRAMGALAAAAYRAGGGADPLIQLVNSSDPKAYLDGAIALDRAAASQQTTVLDLRVLRRDLEDRKTAASQALAAQQVIERQLNALRASIESGISRQKQLIDVLETREARRLRLLAEARAARRARALALARERERAARASRASRARRAERHVAGTSERAAIAVHEALRQLGKPYQWGAAGPDRFDCSGLTMWSWGKAGVSLPHYSRAQYEVGVHVGQNELRPGDLVFYGHPIHHMGMYIGDGQYVHAPQTGDVVKISSIFRNDYAGATRL